MKPVRTPAGAAGQEAAGEPPERPSSYPLVRMAFAGFAAAWALSLVQAGLRFWAGGAWVAELMALGLFERVPMGAFRFFVDLLGPSAKWVALGGMVAAYGLLGSAAALAAGFVRSRTPRWANRALGKRARLLLAGLAMGTLHWALVQALLPPSTLLPQLAGPLATPFGRLASDWAGGVLFVAALQAAGSRAGRDRGVLA